MSTIKFILNKLVPMYDYISSTIFFISVVYAGIYSISHLHNTHHISLLNLSRRVNLDVIHINLMEWDDSSKSIDAYNRIVSITLKEYELTTRRRLFNIIAVLLAFTDHVADRIRDNTISIKFRRDATRQILREYDYRMLSMSRV